MTITTTTSREHGWVPEFELADRLTRTLRETGIGVTEMATRLGVSRDTISRWINGRHEPKKAALIAWSSVTGCDLEWLETGVRHVGLEPTTRWFTALALAA